MRTNARSRLATLYNNLISVVRIQVFLHAKRLVSLVDRCLLEQNSVAMVTLPTGEVLSGIDRLEKFIEHM
jgi:hypothetical protein